MNPRRTAHWVEYALESWALGLFMMSACGFAVLLFHPASPMVRAVPDPLVRRGLMGLAMGGTAVLNAYAPWGRRSGAHANPAVTLTFFRLGRMPARDAAGYITAQFLGGILGMALAAMLLSRWIADPSVNYVMTLPGMRGELVAFAAEVVISFLLMLVILATADRRRLAPYTALFAGGLVALYITLENPLSGMSMNPARSLGSAALAVRWDHLWLYFVAPPVGMLLAVEVRRGLGATAGHACAKLHHDLQYRCLFCEHREARDRRPGTS